MRTHFGVKQCGINVRCPVIKLVYNAPKDCQQILRSDYGWKNEQT
jgi:hypothetical protein